jgi:mannosyl-oligosaccharide glucosidase
LSNLLGGLGFFHGDSKVDETHDPAYDETEERFWEKTAAAKSRAKVTTKAPQSLLTHTPSRPFFPRGFLWDEGFHLLPVLEWDFDLAVEVLQSWLALMDDSGWIAREQILGPEARSKVPKEFQTQYPHIANPPTLLLLIKPMLQKLTKALPYHGNPSVYISDPTRAEQLLKDLLPLFERYYNYFRTSQAGNLSKSYPRPKTAVAGEEYRWRGRTPDHDFASGLDDYPRAQPPHPGELHVDALAWVGAAAAAMHALSTHLGLQQEARVYATQRAAIEHNLDALHWDRAQQAYCDGTVAGDAYTTVCRLGYVSILPFLLGLVGPDHPNLAPVLDLLADPARLWGPHGLRSLSRADAAYGTAEDYWRGAVWMQLNVLAVLRLREVGAAAGRERARAAALAAELRERVVRTVYEGWRATGTVWEQYGDAAGEGRRSRAFTGWTACVLLLLPLGDQGGKGIGVPGMGGFGMGRVWIWWGVVPAAVLVWMGRRRLARICGRGRRGRFRSHVN